MYDAGRVAFSPNSRVTYRTACNGIQPCLMDSAPAGIDDFDLNGTADILWREAATNRVETWLLANYVRTRHGCILPCL